MFVALDLSGGRKRLMEELETILLQSKLKGKAGIKTSDVAFIATAIFFSVEPANAATLELYHRTWAEVVLEFGESLVLPFAEGFKYRYFLKQGVKYLKCKSIDK